MRDRKALSARDRERLLAKMAAIAEHKASGRPYEESHYSQQAPYLLVTMPGRLPLAIHPGSVDFINHDDGYDVTVTIGLEGETDAELIAVTDIAFHRRPGEKAISARGIHGVKVGDLLARAVQTLTQEIDHEARTSRSPVGATAEIRRAMVRAPHPQAPYTVTDEMLRFLAKKWQAAPERRRHETVRLAFAASAEYKTVETEALKKRVRLARRRVDPDTGAPFLPHP